VIPESKFPLFIIGEKVSRTLSVRAIIYDIMIVAYSSWHVIYDDYCRCELTPQDAQVVYTHTHTHTHTQAYNLLACYDLQVHESIISTM